MNVHRTMMIFFCAFFVSAFFALCLPIACIASNDSTGQSAYRVWLAVEVLEKKPALGNSASAFNGSIPVVIVDSATSAYLYVLSGEMVEIGAGRTYYLSVVSGENKRFAVQGAPVQVIRTGEANEQDIVYQREFVIQGTIQADTTLLLPERISSDAVPPEKLRLKPDAATISYNAGSLPECPYIVQFCALSLEKDAASIRDALKKASIQDVRVEPYKDLSRGMQYYRVRAGCFYELPQAKTALETFSKTAQRLKLGVVPIVVKQ